MDNNFQICSLDFRLNTMSECQSFNLDYGFESEVDISQEKIHFSAYAAADDSDVFFFNFKSSSIESLKNRFFVITLKGNYSLTLPLEDAVIDKILMMGSDTFNDSMQWLVALNNNEKFDLITFKTVRFIVDPESLEHGLIREAVDDFDFDLGRLILFDLISVERSIKITDIDLTDMTKKEYTINNQKSIITKDYLKGYIYLNTMGTSGLIESYFISTDSARIFLSELSFDLTKSHIALLEFEHRSYVWVFTFYLWHSTFNFSLAPLTPFGSFTFKFDPKFELTHQDMSKWLRKNDLDQTYMEASLSFSHNQESIAKYKLNIIFNDFVHYKNPSRKLTLRPYEKCVYPLQYHGNNLNFDSKNHDIYYFNELEYNFDPVYKAIGDSQVAFVATMNGANIFTMDGRLICLNISRSFSNDRVDFREIYQLNVHGLFGEKVFEIDSIQRIFFREMFLVVLINQKRLFYAEFAKMNNVADSIEFLELDLPMGFNCHLKQGLVSCTTQAKDGPKTYFFKFQMIDRTVSLSEIMSYLPDFSSSFYPFSYFKSLYSTCGFLNLSINSDKKVALIISNNKKVTGVYPLSFLSHEDAEYTYFTPILKDVQVFITFREQLQVWVIKEKMKLSYPCKKYLINYDSYIGTYLRIGFPLFTIVYKTLDNTLRMLVYQLSSKSISRLVHEDVLDKKGCPSNRISISFRFSLKTFYLVYMCKSSKFIKIFKCSGLNGLNLLVMEDQNRYKVTPEKVPEFYVEVSPPEYKVESKAEGHDIIMSDEDLQKEVRDLEASNSLEIQGDIVSGRMQNSIENVKFISRADLVYSYFIEHEKKFLNVDYVKLFKTSKNKEIGFVSNEFLIQGSDIQNNNFYQDCVKPKLLLLQPDDEGFSNLFLCRNKENLEYVLTDFLKTRMNIKLNIIKLSDLFLVRIQGFLYVFLKAENFFGIHLFKYKFTQGRKGILPLVNEHSIFFDEATSGFAPTDFFHIVFEAKTNSILFLRKAISSEYFSISKLSLIDNFFEAKTIQFFKFQNADENNIFIRYLHFSYF
jgi:hypothetical protein